MIFNKEDFVSTEPRYSLSTNVKHFYLNAKTIKFPKTSIFFSRIVFYVIFIICTLSQLLISNPTLSQETGNRMVIVHLRGVFDAGISLTSFTGLKAINKVAEISGIKNGETTTLNIPSQYLPGEFVLRIDYRGKEADSPYPSERTLFINNQNIELYVNPPFINKTDSIKFNTDEKENTVYSLFMKENNEKRTQLDLLRQLLIGYDSPKSKFYDQGMKEYENRRKEYNTWLLKEAETHKKLYISHLFQFHYIPALDWKLDEKKRMNQVTQLFFEGIDFNDTLIIRTKEINKMMGDFMGIYGLQITKEYMKDSVFTEAGRVACEKASKGHPKLYGWMVDYFYSGFETYQINQGMQMLQTHINNPNCLTNKKLQILKRLKGIEKLKPETVSPDFIIKDSEGKDFEFHTYQGKAPNKLLLFWSADCAHCKHIVDSLYQWFNTGDNKTKIDVIAVSLDNTETEIPKWEQAKQTLNNWKHLRAEGGVNSTVANDYFILSTPVMFIVETKNNTILNMPETFEQFKESMIKQFK